MHSKFLIPAVSFLLLAGFATLLPGQQPSPGSATPLSSGSSARDIGNPAPHLAVTSGTTPDSAATTSTEAPLYPTAMLSPEEELKTFHLPPGYHLELVLSEPAIREPVQAAFDGNGRMYVAEMRTYMQDINGTDEAKPESLVSLHESTKNNGAFDKHSVFADHLVLPRMILPLDDRVLINETFTDTLKSYRDTKGTGTADSVEVFYQGGLNAENMEHQDSGLLWDIDNWLYSAVNNYRLRWTPKGALKESVPANGGQWGAAQDDFGRIFWSNAGGEKGLFHFQVPPAYGALDVTSQFDPAFLAVWPLVPIPDVQGGYSRFRPVEKTLNHFTGCCGQEIFRGDRLPADLYGDALICEPVGRLIRRAKVTVVDGVTHLTNPYDHSEFIRSTDPNFRPVNLTTGPDGCLYIVDMYHGIIQESEWTRPGSYLRPVIQKYGLDKNTGGGRIWRLVYDGLKPTPAPHMLSEPSAKLVTYLAHPNGWWRLTAQKLLVLRQDKSVGPALKAMARTNPDRRARTHALWTLEGLGLLDAGLVREKLRDADSNVRCAALRASETLYKNGDKFIQKDISASTKDKDVNVALQAFMSAKHLDLPNWHRDLTFTINANPSGGLHDLGKQLLIVPRSFDMRHFTASDIQLLQKGQTIYEQVCFACHNYDGTGMPMEGQDANATIAPPLAGSSTVNSPRAAMLSVLLHGLSGPVEGKNYTAQMVSMGANDDTWIASVASYVRNSFGNAASLVQPSDVARLRAATQVRTQPWTLAEIDELLPRPLSGREQWKITASDNPAAAPLALDGKLGTFYTTRPPQKPDQWVQVELPAEQTISTLVLDNSYKPLSGDFPRGFRVQTSTDGVTWGKPIAQGKGSGPVAEITFPPVKTRFLRITQTGSDRRAPWSIGELQLLQPPPGMMLGRALNTPATSQQASLR